MTVDQALLVGMVDGTGQQFDETGCVKAGPTLGVVRQRLARQLLMESAALDEFQGEKKPRQRTAHFVNRGDVRVLQVQCDLDRSSQTRQVNGSQGTAGPNTFQGNEALGADVARLIDNPQPAAGQLLPDLVARNT